MSTVKIGPKVGPWPVGPTGIVIPAGPLIGWTRTTMPCDTWNSVGCRPSVTAASVAAGSGSPPISGSSRSPWLVWCELSCVSSTCTVPLPLVPAVGSLTFSSACMSRRWSPSESKSKRAPCGVGCPWSPASGRSAGNIIPCRLPVLTQMPSAFGGSHWPALHERSASPERSAGRASRASRRASALPPPHSPATAPMAARVASASSAWRSPSASAPSACWTVCAISWASSASPTGVPGA